MRAHKDELVNGTIQRSTVQTFAGKGKKECLEVAGYLVYSNHFLDQNK